MQDVSEIAALAGQLGYPLEVELARIRLELIEHDSSQALFVAESESGSVIGWLHVYRTNRLLGDPIAEIGGIVVHEDHRGLGLGGILLDRSEEWARNARCSAVTVRSNIERTRTPAFYKGAGYTVVKQQNVFEKEL